MNQALKAYLEMKGKHHINANELFAEILIETKGKIPQELIDNGIQNIKQLEQFLLPTQLKKIRDQYPEMY